MHPHSPVLERWELWVSSHLTPALPDPHTWKGEQSLPCIVLEAGGG